MNRNAYHFTRDFNPSSDFSCFSGALTWAHLTQATPRNDARARKRPPTLPAERRLKAELARLDAKERRSCGLRRRGGRC